MRKLETLGWRCVVLILLACPALAQDQTSQLPGSIPRKPVESTHDMIVAGHPLAVEAGMRILARGGTAIDAAIAVQMVLNVVEPQSSGIGGGAFMLYHNGRTGLVTAYDGRETAPAAATADRFLDARGRPVRFLDAVVGGRSVGVPGVLRMLELAHRQYGKLAWAQLFEPAIALAQNGFPVSPRLHASIAAEKHLTQERARDYFYRGDGTPLAAGDTLKNPALANTFTHIARDGADAFYKGEIARDMVETVRSNLSNPGDLAESDLANYKTKVREPMCGSYRGYKICGMPPPSSGGIAVLQILGMLEPFDLKAMGPISLASVHVFSEAGRLAYADRDAYVADPDFVAPPRGLTERSYLRARSALIRFDASIGRAKAGVPQAATGKVAAYGTGIALEFASTSHISIVDKYGNAVAMTTTIEADFGSRLMTQSGFLLNNQLTDFAFQPMEDGKPVANRVGGGKRPRSSMAPTIVYDGKGRVVMIVGSPGAARIINFVAKTIVGVMDWGLDAQAAVDLPNFGSRNGPTELERGTSVVALQPKLEALGEPADVVDQQSGLHAIVRTHAGWMGGADSRREGVARGD